MELISRFSSVLLLMFLTFQSTQTCDFFGRKAHTNNSRSMNAEISKKVHSLSSLTVLRYGFIQMLGCLKKTTNKFSYANANDEPNANNGLKKLPQQMYEWLMTQKRVEEKKTRLDKYYETRFYKPDDSHSQEKN